MITLANRLDSRKFHATLVLLDAVGPLRKFVEEHVEIVDLKRPSARKAIWPLRRSLAEMRPLLAVSSMAYLNFLTLLATRFMQPAVPVIVREANAPDATIESFGSPGLARWFYKNLYPKSIRILSPSLLIGDALTKLCGFENNGLAIVRNPTDVENFRTCAMPIERSPGTGLRFVAAGRLTHQKGFDRLLALIAKCPDDCHLTILGDGPDRQTLEKQVDDLGIRDRVEFRGFVAKPWPWYAGADRFLMTSRWEGMPNAVLEALACGTPVIVTGESGAVAEIAELAAEGAVEIASCGAPFIEAIQKVTPEPVSIPRAALIPAEFEIGSVIRNFEAILSEHV